MEKYAVSPVIEKMLKEQVGEVTAKPKRKVEQAIKQAEKALAQDILETQSRYSDPSENIRYRVLT